MKKIVVMFFGLVFVLECFGQESSKEVIYGNVRADGYQKITKGAHWIDRPVAKAIYEGSHPEGYTVVILDQDFFVRFVDGENNQFDKNYIIFPKGSIVYADNKTNQFYSAICGNKIEYIRPVNLVIVEEKKPEASVSHRIYKEPKKQIFQQSQSVNIYITPLPKEEKKIKIGWIVIPIFAIAVGTATYFLLKNQNHQDNYRNTYTSKPEKNPPVVIPSNPGGPGGTPIPGG